jgi:predicted phosphate transport protein (TIGR00153 family)
MMPGEYFAKILAEKDKKKKGTKLFLKLVKSIEVAYSIYVEAIEAWRKGKYDKGYELCQSIIKLEREADTVKDVFFERIFRKKAYLPQITEERHHLMINADHLLDNIERATRVLCLKKLDESYFPPEFDEILIKTKKVIKLYVEAHEEFFDDFEEASKKARKLEKVRDEVRDLYYIILGKVLNDEYQRGTARLLNATTRISIQAEESIDYLKVLIAKHS